MEKDSGGVIKLTCGVHRDTRLGVVSSILTPRILKRTSNYVLVAWRVTVVHIQIKSRWSVRLKWRECLGKFNVPEAIRSVNKSEACGFPTYSQCKYVMAHNRTNLRILCILNLKVAFHGLGSKIRRQRALQILQNTWIVVSMGCWIGTKNSKTTNAATTDTKILLFYVNIWTTKLLPVPVPCSFKKKNRHKNIWSSNYNIC